MANGSLCVMHVHHWTSFIIVGNPRSFALTFKSLVRKTVGSNDDHSGTLGNETDYLPSASDSISLVEPQEHLLSSNPFDNCILKLTREGSGTFQPEVQQYRQFPYLERAKCRDPRKWTLAREKSTNRVNEVVLWHSDDTTMFTYFYVFVYESYPFLNR